MSGFVAEVPHDDGHGIRNDELFRQKILTGSWQRGEEKLPRRIKGTDLDHWFHTYSDGGGFLFCEFKKRIATWEELSQDNEAQVKAYAALVLQGRSLVALCCHDVPPDRDIDARHDVLSFNLMCQDGGKAMASSEVFDGSRWFAFVSAFITSPSRTCCDVARRISQERRQA